MRGLYIHIPFCRRKCLYCNFYSIHYNQDIASSLVSIILEQIEDMEPDFSALYIGGGTPSILDIDLLDRLLTGLNKIIRYATESTIEVNPESIDYEKLRLFLDKGINRISIGVQSFDDRKLKLLGRIHDVRQSEQAIELSRKIGFKNISIDMIFGVNGETLSSWQIELKKATGFDINHMSCYSLSYEKDTPFFKMKDTALDEKFVADMYRYVMSYLPTKGLEHYEVSNFSKHGFRCAHNLSYWDNNYYIGLGPSSVSYMDGVRSENIQDVIEYINRHEKGMDLNISKEELSPLERAKETASLKIRTKEGINYNWFKNKTGFDFSEIEKEALADLLEDGLIICDNEDTHLTKKGFLFCDTVSSTFL